MRMGCKFTLSAARRSLTGETETLTLVKKTYIKSFLILVLTLISTALVEDFH